MQTRANYLLEGKSRIDLSNFEPQELYLSKLNSSGHLQCKLLINERLTVISISCDTLEVVRGIVDKGAATNKTILEEPGLDSRSGL